jgi:hypothetical protein
VAMPEAVKEIRFIYYLLQDIGIEVKIGAMFMAQNASSGVRTWYHFVQENLEVGIIKIEFFKSVENESDIFTKNVTQEIYETRQKVF